MTDKLATANTHDKGLSIEDKEVYSQNKVTIKWMIQLNFLEKRTKKQSWVKL